jgi:hypothetical protein
MNRRNQRSLSSITLLLFLVETTYGLNSIFRRTNTSSKRYRSWNCALLLPAFRSGDGLSKHSYSSTNHLQRLESEESMFAAEQQLFTPRVMITSTTIKTETMREPQCEFPHTTITPILMSGTKILLANSWAKLKAVSHVDKEAIAKLGIAFGLTYNLISNINGSASLSLAWYIASKKVCLQSWKGWS